MEIPPIQSAITSGSVTTTSSRAKRRFFYVGTHETLNDLIYCYLGHERRKDFFPGQATCGFLQKCFYGVLSLSHIKFGVLVN